jgi:hypothetical protein
MRLAKRVRMIILGGSDYRSVVCLPRNPYIRMSIVGAFYSFTGRNRVIADLPP